MLIFRIVARSQKDVWHKTLRDPVKKNGDKSPAQAHIY